MQDAGLTLKAVWKDADMVELQVVASNGRFAGGTCVYVSVGDLEQCSQQLRGFPATPQDKRRLDWGDLDAHSGLGGATLEFACLDLSAHAGAWVELKAGDVDEIMPSQRVRLFLPVEGAAVDRFVRELAILGRDKWGEASLRSGPTA